MAQILIAEDDTSMLSFLKLALEKAGHHVQTAENGTDAYAHVQDALGGKAPYDLLLTDIVMPGMDGVELSQKTAQISPRTKVMFITGFSAVAVGLQEDNTQHAKILSKPFHLNDLVDQVETLLAA